MMIVVYHSVTPHLGRRLETNSTVKVFVFVQTKSIRMGIIDHIRVPYSSLDSRRYNTPTETHNTN